MKIKYYNILCMLLLTRNVIFIVNQFKQIYNDFQLIITLTTIYNNNKRVV